MSASSKREIVEKAKPIIGIVTAIVLIVLLFIKAVKIFLLVFAGAMVAVFFRSIARLISNRSKLAMKFALPLSVVLVLLLYLSLGFLLAPQVTQQVKQMKETVPRAAVNLEQNLQQSDLGSYFLDLLPFDLSDPNFNPAASSQQQEQTQPTDARPESKTSKFNKRIIGYFSTTLGVLGNLYVVLLLGMFFLANPRPYKKGLVYLFPKARRDRIATVYDASAITLRSWLFGKMLSMLVVFVLSLIGLWIMGIPMFIALALFAGLVSFIPNFGPIIAIIPAFLVGYLESPQTGFMVVGLYILVQVIESNIITPIIMRRQIQIPLAVTLFSQLLLGVLAGGWGLVFATPIVAVVIVLIKMMYVEDVLGDDLNVKGERLARGD